MRKVLITGINGFVGKHLARLFAQMNCEVDGIGMENTVAPEIKQLVHGYFTCNLTDEADVAKLKLQPYGAIISLAGLANVGQSFDQPERYMQINVAVLATICQKLLDDGLSPRIIVISTGAVYDSAQSMPLTENSRLVSQGSPYTQSKIAMEAVVREFQAAGLGECIIVRPFNHIGPGQESGFLVPDMYQKIVEALNIGEPLKTGNLATRRDYTDVRDVVRAYAALTLADSKHLTQSVYNVCSGRTRSGEEILTELKKHISGANNLEVAVDPALMRPDDPKLLVGSNEQLRKAINWQPEIAFEQTIADFVASKQA